ERRTGRVPECRPVGRARDQPGLDARPETDVAPGLENGDDLVGVPVGETTLPPGPLVGPAGGQVRHRDEYVVHVAAGWGQRGIGAGGVRDEDGRVTHEPAVTGDVVEGSC